MFLLFFGHDCACGWLYLSACVCQWEACGVDRLCRRTCHCHRHSLHADRYHHNDSVINETIQKENKARQGKLSQVRTDSVADIDNYHLADSVDDDVLSLSLSNSLPPPFFSKFISLSVGRLALPNSLLRVSKCELSMPRPGAHHIASYRGNELNAVRPLKTTTKLQQH